MYVVYKITSPSNKIYIGMSKNIERRKRVYRFSNCPKQILLHRSLLKYGWINHIFEILEEGLTEQEAKQKEVEYISSFKKKKISLNLTDGGDYTSQRIKKKVYQYSLDKKFIRSFDSLADAGESINVTYNQISAAIKKERFYCKGFFWCFNKKDIDKVSRKKIGGKYKSVILCDLNGKVLEFFDSITEAAKDKNISISNISAHLNNKRGQWKNKLWKYNDK